MTGNWDKEVNKLSGGDKQLLAIIENILKKRSLYIFDEPTSNLDQARAEWFNNMIQKLKR